MGFLGIVVSFTMRLCLSVAITEMVFSIENSKMANNALLFDGIYDNKSVSVF